jgi:hypothetical protein
MKLYKFELLRCAASVAKFFLERFAAPEEALLDEALFLPPPLNNYIY